MFIKPNLSFWQIINMNVGFFGIQYSFGLQQSAVNPIYAQVSARLQRILFKVTNVRKSLWLVLHTS